MRCLTGKDFVMAKPVGFSWKKKKKKQLSWYMSYVEGTGILNYGRLRSCIWYLPRENFSDNR